jgi:hypothetical protein
MASPTTRWAESLLARFANQEAPPAAFGPSVEWITNRSIDETGRLPSWWTAVNQWLHVAATGWLEWPAAGPPPPSGGGGGSSASSGGGS